MESLFEKIWERKIAFLSVFFVVFTLTYIILVAIDFLPEPKSLDESGEESSEIESVSETVSLKDESAQEYAEAADEVTSELAELEEQVIDKRILPTRILIEKIDKDVVVLNPDSRTIADLDKALLSGVVRHPDSATLGQEGNVFILGHSSYLPNVFNKNFQAFNGIQDLEWGDVIEVYSENTVYEYRVEKVYRATAQDVTVPIAGTEKLLTLATCNSFGTVDDRFIVEAIQTGFDNL